MHLLTTTTLLALPLSTLAQYGYGSSPSSAAMAYASSSSAVMSAAEPSATTSMTGGAGMVSVQVVKVSNKDGSLIFSPNSLEAAAGSMVQFQFYPKNHSVVQAAFADPCVPINNVQPTVQGFFSGFMPVTGTETAVYTLPINDTKPIWFYCSQAKHCQAGMVGVINPPANDTSKTAESFAAAAKLAPQNLSPGQMMSANSSTSASASGTTTGGVVQQTTSGASGSVFAGVREIVMSLGLAGAVAAVMLAL